MKKIDKTFVYEGTEYFHTGRVATKHETNRKGETVQKHLIEIKPMVMKNKEDVNTYNIWVTPEELYHVVDYNEESNEEEE